MSKSRIRIERDAAVQKRSANSGTRTASTANGNTRAIPGNQVVSKASGREDPAEQTGVRRYDTASALSEDAAAKEVARAADRIGPYVPSPSPSGTRQVVIERTRVRYRDLSRSADKTAKHPRRAATLRNLEILARSVRRSTSDVRELAKYWQLYGLGARDAWELQAAMFLTAHRGTMWLAWVGRHPEADRFVVLDSSAVPSPAEIATARKGIDQSLMDVTSFDSDEGFYVAVPVRTPEDSLGIVVAAIRADSLVVATWTRTQPGGSAGAVAKQSDAPVVATQPPAAKDSTTVELDAPSPAIPAPSATSPSASSTAAVSSASASASKRTPGTKAKPTVPAGAPARVDPRRKRDDILNHL